MATVMGGVGYGLYFVAKRYIYPVIAPPTPPQLEQDKKAVDESFEKAFSLLDQLAKDTESLKSSEQERTERMDTALSEVETVINELKTASHRREEESRRINDEVRGLKDLIPKAMDGQKESTENRLKELNTELKSLKTLMGQRMNSPATASASQYTRSSTPAVTPSSGNAATNGGSSPDTTAPKAASVSSGAGVESTASLQGRSSSPFSTGTPSGRAAIPSWQMAAANKSSSAVNTTGVSNGSQEAGGAA